MNFPPNAPREHYVLARNVYRAIAEANPESVTAQANYIVMDALLSAHEYQNSFLRDVSVDDEDEASTQ